MSDYNFDPVKTKNDVVAWIRDTFEKNGKNCNAVIGISGGKDSSVVAALCVEALGKDRVIGVLMPNGHQEDIPVALALVDHLHIRHITINIHNAYLGIINNIEQMSLLGTRDIKPIEISEQTKINLPARIRMATLYAVSQSMNGRVMNTCNLSEDWVGYATR
ncbi:MAG: NAD(+) synthase, partial [Eubacterium sp.]|nr:NAD(+) synthase [Eubacterium sp.]